MNNDVFLQRAGQMAGVGGWRLDLATMAVEWSAQTCRILDLPLGHKPAFEEAVNMFAPDARTAIASLIEKATADGTPWDVELAMVTATGRHIWVRSIGEAAYLGDKIVAIDGAFQDITETVQFREQTKQLVREQNAMLDNELIGIIKLRNRTITWANREMHRLAGYEQGTMIGMPARTGYLDEASFLAVGAQAYGAIQAGGTYRCELEMVRHDGSPVWVDLQGVLLGNAQGESMWMMADITERKKRQEYIQHIAFHDALTGLPNRLLLDDRITQALAAAERQHTKLAVCYLDLDGFKAVNDNHGHDAGDKLLVEVSKRLLSCVRADDTVCRLAGDEFVFVLNKLGDTAEFELAVNRVLRAIAEPIELDGGRTAVVSASIGISFFPEDSTEKRILLSQADQAMYKAKTLGRNRFHRFVNNPKQAVEPPAGLI